MKPARPVFHRFGSWRGLAVAMLTAIWLSVTCAGQQRVLRRPRVHLGRFRSAHLRPRFEYVRLRYLRQLVIPGLEVESVSTELPRAVGRLGNHGISAAYKELSIQEIDPQLLGG